MDNITEMYNSSAILPKKHPSDLIRIRNIVNNLEIAKMFANHYDFQIDDWHILTNGKVHVTYKQRREGKINARKSRKCSNWQG